MHFYILDRSSVTLIWLRIWLIKFMSKQTNKKHPGMDVILQVLRASMTLKCSALEKYRMMSFALIVK